MNRESNLKAAKERKIDIVDGFIRLYHGTSPANWKKILKTGKFKSGTWFAQDYDTARRYGMLAISKGQPIVNMTYVDAGSLHISGSYWVAAGDLIEDNKRNNFYASVNNTPMENNNINELTPQLGGTVIDKRHSDKRAERMSNNAVKSVFSQVIGKHFPWYMKVRNESKPHKYMLIDVRWSDKPAEGQFSHNYVIMFDFHTETVEQNDSAPYADEKKQFTITYNVNKDDIIHAGDSDPLAYYYNRSFINGIVKLLTLSRQLFNMTINGKFTYTARVAFNYAGVKYQPGDQVASDVASQMPTFVQSGEKKSAPPSTPTRHSAKTFRSFDFSSNDLQLAEPDSTATALFEFKNMITKRIEGIFKQS